MLRKKTTFVISLSCLRNLNAALNVVSQVDYKAVSAVRTSEDLTSKYVVIIEGPSFYRDIVEKIVGWANFPGILGRDKLGQKARAEFDSDLLRIATVSKVD